LKSARRLGRPSEALRLRVRSTTPVAIGLIDTQGRIRRRPVGAARIGEPQARQIEQTLKPLLSGPG